MHLPSTLHVPWRHLGSIELRDWSLVREEGGGGGGGGAKKRGKSRVQICLRPFLKTG